MEKVQEKPQWVKRMEQRNEENRLRWQQTPTWRKGLTIGSTVLHMVLLTAAMLDLRRRTPEQLNGNKKLWSAIVFIQLVGPISYFLFGRKR